MEELAEPVVSLSERGEIPVDAEGQLLRSYIKYNQNLTGPLLKSFDNLITEQINKIIGVSVIQLSDGTQVRFGNAVLSQPTYSIGDRKYRLTPQYSRLNNLSYAGELNIAIKHFQRIDDEWIQVKEEIRPLTQLPVMLRSSACYMYGKTSYELVEMGEDPNDPGGYFVINGVERVFLWQEKLRINKMSLIKVSEAIGVAVRMIIPSVKTSVLVYLYVSKRKKKEKEKKEKQVFKLYLPSVYQRQRDSVQSQTKRLSGINVLVLFKKLGVETLDEMKRIVALFLNPETAHHSLLELTRTIIDYSQIPDSNVDEYLRRKMPSTVPGERQGKHKKSTPQALSVEQKDERIRLMIQDELFPNMNTEELIPNKKYLLGMMIAMMCEYRAGYRQLDNRDSWSNKQLDSAPRMIEQLFRLLWNHLMREVQKSVPDSFGTVTQKIKSYRTMSENIIESFRSNTWGIKSSKGSYQKENVVQILKRDSLVATLSHLMRADVDTSRNDKNPNIRMVQNTQYGFICAAHTPEGESLGITKHLSVTYDISLERDDETLLLPHIRPFIVAMKDDSAGTVVIVNGKLIGWSNGVELRNRCIGFRRSMLIPLDTSIVLNLDQTTLYIYTVGSRPIRPLLIVDSDHRLIIDKKRLHGAPFSVLLQQGCVEYIDPWEQEYIKLASYTTDIDKFEAEIEEAKILLDESGDDATIAFNTGRLERLQNRMRYTHCEIDPQAVLGVAASIIPFADRIQAPRVLFQCSMGSQCLHPDTPVLMADGTSKKIGQIKIGEMVKTFNPENMEVTTTKVVYQFASKTEKQCFDVMTVSGRKITATFDHKFMTSDGWKEVREFVPGETLLGISSEQDPVEIDVSERIILDECGFTKFFESEKIPIDLYIKELKSRNLLPLTSTSLAVPILARIFGYIMTDGFGGLYDHHDVKRASFVGTFGSLQGAHDFNHDLVTLGFEEKTIDERFNDIKGVIHHGYYIRVNGSLAALIICLGLTTGKKTLKPTNEVPEWIMNGSMMTKREFLAGLQGGDGSRICHKLEKNCHVFTLPALGMSKTPEYLNSLVYFMNQVKTLFEQFGVKIMHIKEKKSKYDKVIVNLKIQETQENMLKYFTTIGYRYDHYKIGDSARICEYLRYLNRIKEKYHSDVSKIRKLHDEGHVRREIADILELPRKWVSDVIGSYNRGVEISTPKLLPEQKFDHWLNYKVVGSTVFIPIDSVVPSDNNIISDITTESENHSFIAAGFCVHNSLSEFHRNHRNRFDGKIKILAYPNRPLFEPQMNKTIGLNDNPAGMMLTIAFMNSPYNQEDAFLINRAAIDRGWGRMFKYIQHQTEVKADAEIVETLERPHVRVNENREIYRHINENGLPTIGAYLKSGDCVIGKIQTTRDSTGTKITKNESIFMGIGEEGIVETVQLTAGQLVRVKLRTMRTPILGDKLASRYAQKGTIGRIVEPEDMFYTAEGITPDIIVNPISIPSRMTCFVGSTQVTLSNGLSRSIDSLTGTDQILSWSSGERGLKLAPQTAFISQGVKEIVRLTFADGRMVKCTPDHRFLTQRDGDFEWVEAKDLTYIDRIVMGPDAVEDVICSKENGWKLETEEHVFTMTSHKDRCKTLAFARILGFVLADGSCSYAKEIRGNVAVSVTLGHQIDIDEFLSDVEMITCKTPKAIKDKGSWSIHLPADLGRSIALLPGMVIGDRIKQPTAWPIFLLEESTPLSVLREFVAGFFGGDGWSPGLRLVHGKWCFSAVALSQTSLEVFGDSLRVKIEQLRQMLEKLNVSVYRISGPEVRKHYNGIVPKDVEQNPRVQCTIYLKPDTDFGSKIGFRYCCHKQYRLTAAQTYWRYLEHVKKQHDFVVHRTHQIFSNNSENGERNLWKNALNQARGELDEFPLNEKYSLSSIQDVKIRFTGSYVELQRFRGGIPDAKEFHQFTGCLNWFPEEGQMERVYGVSRESKVLPFFTLNLVNLKSVGSEEVYDISVSKNESFLANGITVHNCSYLIELLTGKTDATVGRRTNATSFRDLEITDIMKELEKFGYADSGEEELFSAETGRPLVAKIFMGPCYFQMLRHHTLDKIQVRRTGTIDPLTHQPVKGRGRAGGLRSTGLCGG